MFLAISEYLEFEQMGKDDDDEDVDIYFPKSDDINLKIRLRKYQRYYIYN